MEHNPISEFIESIALLGPVGLCIGLVVIVVGVPVWATAKLTRYAWGRLT